ncbi:MAG TPA: ATP-binding cassette domain-containing protein [Rhabdochlamydiaceae bacterium]|jgi:ABC-2 type transport system ATP-binding protein|nr:ATP-binding cassette domain-containing protein [Rhabdochlamydiaceae bacterium]
MSETFVEIHDLTKLFSPQQPPALKEINVSITKGKIIGLVGPDGAGKTTLIRLMAGLLTPTSGTITVEGYDTIKDSEYIHYLTGYMPQKFGLYEDLTVQQNLDLYAELRNVLGKEKEAVCEKLLEFTGLKAFKGFLAKNLSGGMKQKLGLACSLVKKPAFLLLDEPSVGVDPISRRELWKMVNVLLEEGISVLWSTAYLDEAEKCNMVLLLNEGKLLFSGDPKKLTERVEGRVFEVTEIEGDRRKLLFKLLKDKNVIDGVIQGRDLRIVVRERAVEVKGPKMERVAPRFEDAFIDILGGGPGGESKLADLSPVVKNDDQPAVIAKNLVKKFGAFTAVDGISLTVKKGEIFGLLGPNGAGKTTTFKMLCGLLKPTSGEAFVKGLDLLQAPGQARARLGYMAQKFSLYGNLSVRQNLEFFSGIYNLKNAEKKAAIEEMIDVFSLAPYLSLSSEMLPLGFKQRLSLACANMHHPEVLFLDEPTSGVDPITRREFWNHINGLVGKGVTIMITTHFMGEAEYCDRIALIYGGKIIQSDAPNGLKDKVKSEKNPNPTLEDAFIQMIEEYDK